MLAFMGVTATVCGMLLIVTDGLGVDRTDLAESPFESFLIPGLILTFIVGGSHLVASLLLLTTKSSAFSAALASGAILIGWIIVEAIMIPSGRTLQGLILLYGLVETGLSIRLWLLLSPAPL